MDAQDRNGAPQKRSRSEIGKANRAKGARREREVAIAMGGKRTPMSGGSVLGGGDIVFPNTDPFADFVWEVKSRAKVPEIVGIALKQAQLEAGKSFKKPAGVIIADNSPAIVTFYLEDFVQWARALAEMGSGSRVKSLLRDARKILDEIERMA